MRTCGNRHAPAAGRRLSAGVLLLLACGLAPAAQAGVVACAFDLDGDSVCDCADTGGASCRCETYARGTFCGCMEADRSPRCFCLDVTGDGACDWFDADGDMRFDCLDTDGDGLCDCAGGPGGACHCHHGPRGFVCGCYGPGDVWNCGCLDADEDMTCDARDQDLDGFFPAPAGTDCDDTNPAVHPGAREACTNGLDDDCDGLTDGEDRLCDPGDWVMPAASVAGAPPGTGEGATLFNLVLASAAIAVLFGGMRLRIRRRNAASGNMRCRGGSRP